MKTRSKVKASSDGKVVLTHPSSDGKPGTADNKFKDAAADVMLVLGGER
jgi:hypothetical protein